MRWKLIVGVFVALVVYVVVGGVVFWFLEAIDNHHHRMQQLPLTSSSDQVLTVASIQQELNSQLIQQLNISSAQGLYIGLI